MQILFYLGGCFGRRPEGCNSLGFSVLCICLSDPFSGGDLGFALSVMSTLGLLVFRAPIARGLGRLAPRAAWEKAVAPRGRVPLHHLRGDRLYPAAAGGGVRHPAPGLASGQPGPHLPQQFAAVLRVPLRPASAAACAGAGRALPVRRRWLAGSCCGRPGFFPSCPSPPSPWARTPGCWRWGSSCCSCFWPPCPPGAPPHQIRRPGHGGGAAGCLRSGAPALAGRAHRRRGRRRGRLLRGAAEKREGRGAQPGRVQLLFCAAAVPAAQRGPAGHSVPPHPGRGRPAWPPWSC